MEIFTVSVEDVLATGFLQVVEGSVAGEECLGFFKGWLSVFMGISGGERLTFRELRSFGDRRGFMIVVSVAEGSIF